MIDIYSSQWSMNWKIIIRNINRTWFRLIMVSIRKKRKILQMAEEEIPRISMYIPEPI